MFTKRDLCVFCITVAFVCLLTILSLNDYFDQESLLRSNYRSIQQPRPSLRREYPASSSLEDTVTAGDVILFSAPQKCAGRTVYELVEFISNQTHSSVTRDSIMNLDRHWPPNVSVSQVVPKVVRDRIQASQPLELVYTHFSFVDFSNESSPAPSYVSIIRDPFERQRSFYYFKRYGDTMEMTVDAKEWRQRIEKKNLSTDSYDECVRKQKVECVGDRSRFELIRHFCGYENDCYGDPGNALQIAKRNIEDHYVIIGLTEEFEDFLRALELFFPIHFNDALKFYNTEKFSEIVSTTRTKIKLPASNATRRIMLQKMSYEYDLYYFIKERFYDLKEKILKQRTF